MMYFLQGNVFRSLCGDDSDEASIEEYKNINSWYLSTQTSELIFTQESRQQSLRQKLQVTKAFQ